MDMGSVETWALIEEIVKTLVGEMESHRTEEVDAGLRDIASRVTSTTELMMVMPELMLLLGENSKTLQALKMVRTLWVSSLKTFGNVVGFFVELIIGDMVCSVPRITSLFAQKSFDLTVVVAHRDRCNIL